MNESVLPLQPKMGQEISAEIVDKDCLEQCQDCSTIGLFTVSAGAIAGLSARVLHRCGLGLGARITPHEALVALCIPLGAIPWQQINNLLADVNEPRRQQRAEYLAQLKQSKEV